jgi:hypothetical protein
MPFVAFTVRHGISAADKSRLSEVMLEAQITAGYHRADRFHRSLEVDQCDFLVGYPGYATDRTDRFRRARYCRFSVIHRNLTRPLNDRSNSSGSC